MYFLSDQQPEELAEGKREIRDILMENRLASPNQIRDESSLEQVDGKQPDI